MREEIYPGAKPENPVVLSAALYERVVNQEPPTPKEMMAVLAMTGGVETDRIYVTVDEDREIPYSKPDDNGDRVFAIAKGKLVTGMFLNPGDFGTRIQNMGIYSVEEDGSVNPIVPATSTE